MVQVFIQIQELAAYSQIFILQYKDNCEILIYFKKLYIYIDLKWVHHGQDVTKYQIFFTFKESSQPKYSTTNEKKMAGPEDLLK